MDEGTLGYGMEVCPCQAVDELFRIGPHFTVALQPDSHPQTAH